MGGNLIVVGTSKRKYEWGKYEENRKVPAVWLSNGGIRVRPITLF